ncbi:YheT family hydrolase [Moraxella atlantae]|uniref:YheT family hydrolase n=1 Tax=Faucicola atlantae TaxID=34059 RepID=UPI0037533820
MTDQTTQAPTHGSAQRSTFNIHALKLKPFNPAFWLANPHIQTILPRFVPIEEPAYQRELLPDSTGETLVAYDFVYANGAPNLDKPLATMFHGLEGSSDSAYAKAFVLGAQRHGWDAVIVHFRGCGGVENTAYKDYHAGDTHEAQFVLTQLKQRYAHVFAAGVSLGGNMLARYMGETGDAALCDAAVVISAPVDLFSAAVKMHRGVAKRVYTPYLLKPLVAKALKKTTDPMTRNKLQKLHFIDGFDDIYTAPRNGFADAADYYRQSSALPVLQDISKPSLLIQAKDDPFVGIRATVDDISDAVRLLYSKHGGHVGFIDWQDGKFSLDWLPNTVMQFFMAVYAAQINH